MNTRYMVVLALAVVMSATLFVTAGCSGEDESDGALVSEAQPFQTVLPLPTSTLAPTEATDVSRRRRASDDEGAEPGPEPVTRLPDDPDTVVFQYARVGDSPWEPEILSSMTPALSLTAGGHGVFPYVGGPSDVGWYQTIVTPTLVLDLIKILADDVGVFELADTHHEASPLFETNRDGTPGGTGPVVVVYVHDGEEHVQLVMRESVLAEPELAGDDARQVERLAEVLAWVDLWRSGVVRDDLAPYAPLGLATMGWWSHLQVPYSPSDAVVFGTKARSRVDPEALVATWAVTRPLSALIEAPYGSDPVEVPLVFPNELGLLAEATIRDRAAVEFADRDFWGPLWNDFHDSQRYLVGIRSEVPGGNHVVFDYDYVVPKRGLALR